MDRDSLQKRLQEMEIKNPSPILETAKSTLKEGESFSREIKQIPQRSFVDHKILRDILYNSRVNWIEHYAKEFANRDFFVKTLMKLGIQNIKPAGDRVDILHFHDRNYVGQISIDNENSIFSYFPEISLEVFQNKKWWDYNTITNHHNSNDSLSSIIFNCRKTKSSRSKKIKPEEITITPEHYKKAIRELGDDFLVDELDMNLKNLFSNLKMIAHRGEMRMGVGIDSRTIFYGVLDDGKKHYSVEHKSQVGGDSVSISIGDTGFIISDESFLNLKRALGENGLFHYGAEIPKDILTKLLDGRVDEDRMDKNKKRYKSILLDGRIDKDKRIERNYIQTYESGIGGSPANPIQEFWAKLFPGSIRAMMFDFKYGTNYSGRRVASRDISARDVSEAKRGRGKYAGKTGDIFIDSPSFNPWAPSDTLNKK